MKDAFEDDEYGVGMMLKMWRAFSKASSSGEELTQRENPPCHLHKRKSVVQRHSLRGLFPDPVATKSGNKNK